MAATTTGQRVLPLLAKSLRHAPLLAASFTEDLDIRCLARYSQFAQFQASFARYFSVHEVDPGKIVEVPVFTSGQETRGNHRRRGACRGTVHVHIARLVWPVEIGLELEEARVQRCQRTAARAEHPARESRYRNAYGGAVIKGVGRSSWRLWRFGWREEPRHLRAQDGLNCLQEALFTDQRGIGMFPIVKPHHNGRDVGKIDNGADAIGKQDLRGT